MIYLCHGFKVTKTGDTYRLLRRDEGGYPDDWDALPHLPDMHNMLETILMECESGYKNLAGMLSTISMVAGLGR